MSPQESTALIQGVYRAYNQRDFDGAAELCAEDLVLSNVATGEQFRGREGYLQYARGWAAAFPDSRIEVREIGGRGETAVVEYALRGTHTGTLIGSHGHIPPTWTQVDLSLVDVVELRGGEIARVRVHFDTGTLLRQMGLFPNSPLHAPDRRAALDLYALGGDAPTQQQNKAVVQRFVDGVINRHVPAAAAEFCAPNLAWHGGPMGELRDLASYQQMLTGFFASFPDLQLEVEDLIAEGDRVAARMTLRATHRGDFQGIPPTGKRVTGTASATYRVVNGKIAEEWWQHDLFTLMKQLDAMPAMVRLSDG